MSWMWKAALHQAVSALPRGKHLHYGLQRYGTGGLTIREATVRTRLRDASRHLQSLTSHIGPLGPDAIFLEIGPGWHLGTALAFYAMGVERQVLVDVRALLRPRLSREFAAMLARLEDDRLRRLPDLASEHTAQGGLKHILRTRCGIDYRAPLDARQTKLEADSVTCITSTFTFEHIPADELPGVLQECRRILSPSGAISLFIDYQDHYSYWDHGISRYNFLRYSEQRWKLFNPRSHFQNRLRHADYIRLLDEAGFQILEQNCHHGSPRDQEILGGLRLDQRFGGYSLEDLGVRSGQILARKKLDAT